MKQTHAIHRAAILRRSAFTLIEIVIVLTIISLLGAGVILMTKGYIDTAKETRVQSDIDKIMSALQMYEARNLRMPTTDQGLKALAEKPTTEPIPERWTTLMEEVPKDPWGQDYKYKNPGTKSKKGYDVWTVGQDGIDGNEDDLGNWKATAAAK